MKTFPERENRKCTAKQREREDERGKPETKTSHKNRQRWNSFWLRCLIFKTQVRYYVNKTRCTNSFFYKKEKASHFLIFNFIFSVNTTHLLGSVCLCICLVISWIFNFFLYGFLLTPLDRSCLAFSFTFKNN